MCVAIVRRSNAVIPENYLRNSYEGNGDGSGIAYPDNGKVVVKKGKWTWEQFLAEYNNIPKEKPMLVHFRWETCGENSEANCHPFSLCDGKYAMIHNGHISIKLHENKSDTATFAELVLEPLLKRGIAPAVPALSFLVEQFIGVNNKIAIMDSEGEVTIYNEEKGIWEDNNNVWYSNTGYKYAKVVRGYLGNSHFTENEWETGSKKKHGSNENGSESNGNTCGIAETDACKEFSDEIELEIRFCMDELSFTRNQAIDYLLYEGVLEKDEEGKVKESNSNHSVMGM